MVKRKIIAIWIIALFFAISINQVEAADSSEEIQNEPIFVEIGSALPDGTFTTETLVITEEELTQLETALNLIMDEIETTNNFDWGFLKDLIEKIFGESNSFLGKFLGIFSTLKMTRNRGFVISYGQGIDYNPIKKISFKIRKRAGVWHYNSNGAMNDRTIIVKPLALKFKSLKGPQFGFMTRFLGIYISISRGFLGQSNTFFMGTARHINGFQLMPNT